MYFSGQNIRTTEEAHKAILQMDMGSEQETAFAELKQQLVSVHVKAYFNQDAETHLIV